MAKPPYNPLDKANLGKSVAEALIAAEAHPLGELREFPGAGIYAIYYRGDHPGYERLAEANADGAKVPIYVGKAIPSGGRKGLAVLSDRVEGTHLYRRLREHAESVELAENLDIADFGARWLVVDDIWIPLGETLMIQTFQPVWNQALDGFGNHDPGAGRYNGLCPRWDALHPGRPWAQRLREREESSDDLVRRVGDFLARVEFPEDPQAEIAKKRI